MDAEGGSQPGVLPDSMRQNVRPSPTHPRGLCWAGGCFVRGLPEPSCRVREGPGAKPLGRRYSLAPFLFCQAGFLRKTRRKQAGGASARRVAAARVLPAEPPGRWSAAGFRRRRCCCCCCCCCCCGSAWRIPGAAPQSWSSGECTCARRKIACRPPSSAARDGSKWGPSAPSPSAWAPTPARSGRSAFARPGFFGANCNARCPEQFWGPDCKQNCRCHPQGRCHPASGECSCHLGWWGPLCQSACLCGQRGHCHPVTGTCRCDPGWWAPDCRRQCQCNLLGSRCDPATGRCLCHRGWWGRRCASLCSCNGSPCAQESGRCECTAGWWGAACQHLCQCVHGLCIPQDGRCTCDAGYRGPNCAEACPEGTYGPQCAHSCGHCRNREPCSPTQGACLACDPGWNGTHCRQPCPLGLYGENCTQPCPRHCLQGETCQPQTGRCWNCEAGFTGARCEAPCPPGFFGEGCRSSCPNCFNGSCDPGSGTCLCQPGYWGTSCNQTCPEASHGPNCSAACPCAGGPCHPVSGACPWEAQGRGPLLAGIVGPLLLLLLLGLFCCCQRCRGAASVVRAPGAEQDLFPPMKHRLMAGLPSLPSSWPCFSRGGSKLPRVTVAHRDPEVPFNPSFIEPMSTACPWDSSFSSASEGANEEMGGCQEGPQSAPPPREALPEGSLLPSPFAIPRTSSLAKGKRPSVSFAEGTHFGPQSPRAPPEALNPTQKPCPASKSSVQGAPPPQVNRPTGASCHSPGRSCYENVAPVPWEDSGWAPAGHHPGSSQHLAQRAGTPDSATVEACVHEPSITTIYVTVGQAGRGSEEPPPAAQQHQGSRQEAAAQPRSLQKLPWKALDAAKGTSRKLAPEKKPSTAEAQGLLAPDEQVDGGGSSGSLKP